APTSTRSFYTATSSRPRASRITKAPKLARRLTHAWLPAPLVLIVQFTLDGDDAAALQRIADVHGEQPGEAVRSLIREASTKAA
ncbi:MAG TPA: hypothetical protein VG188_12630, partial [Solirubrobacteraceae bacterium]|nr:hypothetical protein [Solirubrobacteraceae bacterium]